MLEQGTDFEVRYQNNVNAGTAGMTIIGKGDYSGEISGITFRIYPKLITPEVALSGTLFTYTGKEIKPGATVKDGSNVLARGTDYTISYSNNVNAGTGYAKVICKGNYKGEKTASFRIEKKTGWHMISGEWYYYKPNGQMAASEWARDSKDWCYLGSDGRMVTNDWAKDSKGWCWIGGNGYMVEKTQWIAVGNDWYYIEKGYRVQNAWRKDSKGWCWLQANGKMLRNGWAKDSKGWCWIGEEGYMIEKDMWIGDEGEAGSNYIINGYRVDNKNITIDGTEYTFDAAGKLILQ